jgi:hypothetical protein
VSRGSLTLVGMGPGPRRLLTVDALACLSAAAADPEARAYCAPGLAPAVAECVPELAVTALPALPEWVPGDRNASFGALVQRLFAEAWREGRRVLYLAHGNPLVVGDFALLLRQTAHRYKKRVDVVPGLSFVDIALQRLFWKADPGLQLLSAWRVAMGTIAVRPDCPALLYEMDELGAPGTEPRLGFLGRVAATFPPDHPVALLSGDPASEDGVAVRAISLVGAGSVPIDAPSSLWIPALRGPESERAVLSEMPAR